MSLIESRARAFCKQRGRNQQLTHTSVSHTETMLYGGKTLNHNDKATKKGHKAKISASWAKGG
jgi:hypothetical protein